MNISKTLLKTSSDKMVTLNVLASKNRSPPSQKFLHEQKKLQTFKLMKAS